MSEELLSTPKPGPAPWAKVAARLLQGAVFEDQTELWDLLLQYQGELRPYFGKLALELLVDVRDGYAYLRQAEDDMGNLQVSLVTRRALTYEQSLVCVLLREWLDEFETDETADSRELYISPRMFRDRVTLFFAEKSNQLKWIQQLDKHLRTLVDLGFLKPLNTKTSEPDDALYQVRRIIRARVTPDKLEEFKALMENEEKIDD